MPRAGRPRPDKPQMTKMRIAAPSLTFLGPVWYDDGAMNAIVSAMPLWVVPVSVVAFIVLALGLGAAGIFNRLTRLRNAFRNAFAQIDVQLQRRYDLIPNLVETVKGYAAHERETLEAVIKARNVASAAAQAAAASGSADAIERLAAAEASLGGALSRLLVTVERYPDLKANQNFLALQEELTSTENRVSFARQAYNDAVTAYNDARGVFPAILLAGAFGFAEARLLETESAETRTVPKVKF